MSKVFEDTVGSTSIKQTVVLTEVILEADVKTFVAPENFLQKIYPQTLYFRYSWFDVTFWKNAIR